MNGLYGAWRACVQLAASVILMSLLIANNASASQPRTLLVLGDSLSAGYGLRANQGWVALVAQKMRVTHPDWKVVNASISGETTAGGVARIQREIARTRPSVLVVELGANDGLRGLPLLQTRKNLEAILRSASVAKAQVLLIGMRLPPNLGPQYTRQFAQNYSSLARQYDTAFVPFLLEPIASDRAWFQRDSVHPTAAAQPKLRDHVWPALRPLLD